ncbi:MAG: hypothetical protein KG003_06045 [Bacteroidetes bacterium]|nr:hypothetical protein [Bacteroidota bacterium]
MKPTYFILTIFFFHAQVKSQNFYAGIHMISQNFFAKEPILKHDNRLGANLVFGRTLDSGFLLIRNIQGSLIYYQGAIRAGGTSYAGSFFSGVDLETQKLSATIAILPISIKLKKFRFSLGGESVFNLWNKTNGTIYSLKKFDSLPPNYSGPGYYQTQEILTKHSNKTLPVSLGFLANMKYQIGSGKIGDFYLNYQFHQGFTTEFKDESIVSQRHILGILWQFSNNRNKPN